MKKIIYILLLSAFSVVAIAQSESNKDSSEVRNYALQKLTGEKYNDPGNRHVNIYFREDWMPGKIIFTSGHELNSLYLKFNGANNYLIIRNERIGQIRVDNQIVSDFYLIEGKEEYHFKKVKIDTLNSDEIFCQFIFKSKIELYVYRRVKSVATYNTPEGMRRIYRPKPIYILLINNKIILLNKATQSAVYEQFPNLKDKIKERNNPNYKKIKTEKDFFTFLKEIEDILVEIVQ